MSEEIEKRWVPVAKLLMPCGLQEVERMVASFRGMQRSDGPEEDRRRFRAHVEIELETTGIDCLVIEELKEDDR